MKRWHEEAGRTHKQWKFYKSTGGKNKSVGCFRKRKAMDCGNSRCYLCHYDKIVGIPNRQQMAADIELNEQLNELE